MYAFLFLVCWTSLTSWLHEYNMQPHSNEQRKWHKMDERQLSSADKMETSKNVPTFNLETTRMHVTSSDIANKVEAFESAKQFPLLENLFKSRVTLQQTGEISELLRSRQIIYDFLKSIFSRQKGSTLNKSGLSRLIVMVPKMEKNPSSLLTYFLQSPSMANRNMGYLNFSNRTKLMVS